MTSQTLIDTGFIFAVLDESDENHKACSNVYENEIDALLPEIVFTELAYLLLRAGNYNVLINFLRRFATSGVPVATLELQDFKRIAEILEQYEDSKIDFVDAAIMAMAERLNITRILTVDRRDFALFRPRHCEYFEIIP